jgi:hypothetical protein
LAYSLQVLQVLLNTFRPVAGSSAICMTLYFC